MNRVLRLVPLLLVIVLVASPTATINTKAQGNSGNVIIEGNFAGDVKNLNPLLASDTASARITGFLFPGLIGVDPKTANLVTTKYPGAVLDSMATAKDGLTYSFKLRNDHKWIDVP